MLVLTRRAGESIVIGDNVHVVVLDSRGETVRLGIEAPRSVQVHRAEVFAEVQAANAAALAPGDLGPLADRLTRAARPRNSGSVRGPIAASRRGSARDAAPARARRMVTMTESDERLEQVRARIDEARNAADEAEPDLLPQSASPADDSTFEPSGDGRHAGENPSEGPDQDAPGDLDKDD